MPMRKRIRQKIVKNTTSCLSDFKRMLKLENENEEETDVETRYAERSNENMAKPFRIGERIMTIQGEKFQ